MVADLNVAILTALSEEPMKHMARTYRDGAQRTTGHDSQPAQSRLCPSAHSRLVGDAPRFCCSSPTIR